MAYKALYRTYRPNSFQEVVGQKIIVSTLQRAIETNKIAHAYLFCGPRGTGKTSVAKIFAKAINCTGDIPPCGTCDNCKAMSLGNHPDIIEIDAASNNGVDEVRDLIEKVKYAPIEGKFKVYIIDEVHMMTTGAFNALLKTIEEPPEHVIFILATTEPHKVLATILSRCQRFDFSKVDEHDMITRLEEVCIKENKKVEEGTLELVSQLADGGMRDALSILDQCLAYAQDILTLDSIYDVYGMISLEEKVSFLESIFTKEMTTTLEAVLNYSLKGVDLKRLTNDLITIVKESVIFETTNESKLLSVITPSQANRLRKVSTSTVRIAALEILIDTLQKYSYSSNVATYFEITILKLLDFRASTTVDKEIIQKNNTDNVITLESQVNKENVSRETFMDMKPKIQGIIPEIKVELEIEYLLQLLVSANKALRSQMEQTLQEVNQYTMNFEYAKYASQLQLMNLIAAGENYLLFKTQNQLVANQYNEIQKSEHHQKFMKELFGEPKYIFVIDDGQASELIEEFKTRSKTGSLPGKIVLEDIRLNNQDAKEKTKKDLVTDLFGSTHITFKED